MKINVKYIPTDIAHFIGGLLAAILTVNHLGLTAFLTSLFLIYEFDESWHINDEAFRDIKIYLIGGFVGAIAILKGILP